MTFKCWSESRRWVCGGEGEGYACPSREGAESRNLPRHARRAHPIAPIGAHVIVHKARLEQLRSHTPVEPQLQNYVGRHELSCPVRHEPRHAHLSDGCVDESGVRCGVGCATRCVIRLVTGCVMSGHPTRLQTVTGHTSVFLLIVHILVSFTHAVAMKYTVIQTLRTWASVCADEDLYPLASCLVSCLETLLQRTLRESSNSASEQQWMLLYGRLNECTGYSQEALLQLSATPPKHSEGCANPEVWLEALRFQSDLPATDACTAQRSDSNAHPPLDIQQPPNTRPAPETQPRPADHAPEAQFMDRLHDAAALLERAGGPLPLMEAEVQVAATLLERMQDALAAMQDRCQGRTAGGRSADGILQADPGVFPLLEGCVPPKLEEALADLDLGDYGGAGYWMCSLCQRPTGELYPDHMRQQHPGQPVAAKGPESLQIDDILRTVQALQSPYPACTVYSMESPVYLASNKVWLCMSCS